MHCLAALFSVFLLLSVPLFIGYSTSFASAKKPSGASNSGGGNNTGQTGSNNGGSTGSTNQQQCPNGEHFDNKKNKCVTDTSNQQGQGGTMSTHNATTPLNCVGETHYDARIGGCVDNSSPLPDGSCVAGWQISPQNDCTKIPTTSTTPSTQSNNNSGTGGSGASGQKTLFGPILSGPKTTGGLGILNTPAFSCPKGTHYEQKYDKCLDKNLLITTLDCTGETHANPIINQCEPDSQHLPLGLDPWHNGGCSLGFHIDNVLDPSGHTCFPETTTGTTAPNALPTGIPCPSGLHQDPKTGNCNVECPAGLHLDHKTSKCFDDNGIYTEIVCAGETHYDPVEQKCVGNDHALPYIVGGQCTKGYHVGPNPPGGCVKDTLPTTTTTTPQTQLPSNQSNNTKTGGGGNGTTTGGNKSSTTTPSAHTQSNKTSTNTNTVINQNTVRGQAGVGVTASPSSVNSGPAYTQTPSMSMWSLSLGKSTFAKEGLRLLANLKPFGTIGVPYTLDISFNLPSNNVSLIAAQLTKAGLQHAVIIPINKIAEGAAGESLYQAELGQTITGINPFTKHPDAISGGGATDLLLFNNGNRDIVFNDDNGATMTLRYR